MPLTTYYSIAVPPQTCATLSLISTMYTAGTTTAYMGMTPLFLLVVMMHHKYMHTDRQCHSILTVALLCPPRHAPLSLISTHVCTGLVCVGKKGVRQAAEGPKRQKLTAPALPVWSPTTVLHWLYTA